MDRINKPDSGPVLIEKDEYGLMDILFQVLVGLVMIGPILALFLTAWVAGKIAWVIDRWNGRPTPPPGYYGS